MIRIFTIFALLLSILTTAPLPAIAGAVTEFPVTGGAVSVTEGFDGNLWATNYGYGQIMRISPSGVASYFDVAGAGSLYDIVTAPDGNMWFTDMISHQIGKITPAGIITLIPVPSTTLGIAVGPDGAIWFVEKSANKIGRLPANATAATVPQEFAIPTANSWPWFITAGPDGAMWFSEHFSGKIGRIPVTATPANPHITEYTLAATPMQPYGVTGGADGAIWFTESFANRVGRIPVNATPGTNSQISFFPIPDSGITITTPFQIKSGPDGGLWLVDSSANLYRMSLSGFFTKYAFATASVATAGLTFTKNGDLWVTNVGAPMIARISAFKTPHAWTSQGEGDFDGDGTKDVLWRNSAGTFRIWYMSAGAVAKDWPVSGPTSDWRIAGIGDFYGDKHDSILWQNTKDGRLMIYRFGARLVVRTKSTLPTRMPTGWQVEQAGDLNHDLKADILWRYGTGAAKAWLMNGSTIVSEKTLPTLP